MTKEPEDFEELPDPLLGDVDDAREGRGFVPEFLRKAAVAGLGALFMTEEGVRGLAGQLKLPKEALGFVMAQAEKTKDEVGRVISEEVRRFLQSEKLREEFLKLLSGMSVEVTAQIRLVPDPEAPKRSEVSGKDASSAHVPKVTITDVSAGRHARRKKS